MTIRHLIITLLLVCCGLAQAQDQVQSQLEQFDKKPSATTANGFFDLLLKAEFIDEKVVFANATPIDSMQQ